MKYPFEEFRKEVIQKLSDLIKEKYGLEVEIKLERPKEIADLAFPCFSIAKKIKKNPVEIAEELAKIEGEWIERTEALRGYVNFFINHRKVAKTVIRQINEMGDDFGKLKSKSIKVIVEHTSANPNGPLHVGRARNPIIGDTVARLLKFGGYEVRTQYYIDDMGKQVAILFWGVKNLRISPENKKPDHFYVNFYQKAVNLMEKDEKIKEEIGRIIERCEKGDKKILEEIEEVYSKVLEGITESLRNLNIEIDEFVKESKFILDGSTQEVIRKIEKSPYAGKEGKAIYIDLEPFGIHGREKKFYLTRSDGTSLYATRDIAYHIWKAEQADKMINILGEDHKLEAKFVEIALKLLNKKIPEVIFYSFVSLPEGKMSTRKGRVIYLDDLIEEAINRAREEVRKREIDREKIEYIARNVAIGAIRYNIVKVRAEKPIIFKWEDALNFEGQSAPFIQYSHARCCSILKKSKYSGDYDGEYEHESEIKLIKAIAMFPEVVKEGIESRNPSIIAEYAYDVASKFNAFYRDCRVIGSKQEKSRIALVNATRQVLRNTLFILGITALEEM